MLAWWQIQHPSSIPAVNDLGDVGLLLTGAGLMGMLALNAFRVLKNVGLRGDDRRGESLAEISTTVTAAARTEVRVVSEEIKEIKLGMAAMTTALQSVALTMSSMSERLQSQSREARHDLDEIRDVLKGLNRE